MAAANGVSGGGFTGFLKLLFDLFSSECGNWGRVGAVGVC
jgi:hypothetical protein